MKAVVRVPGNRDSPGFVEVLELAMTAPDPVEIPAIRLDQLDYVSDLHSDRGALRDLLAPSIDMTTTQEPP